MPPQAIPASQLFKGKNVKVIGNEGQLDFKTQSVKKSTPNFVSRAVNALGQSTEPTPKVQADPLYPPNKLPTAGQVAKQVGTMAADVPIGALNIAKGAVNLPLKAGAGYREFFKDVADKGLEQTASEFGDYLDEFAVEPLKRYTEKAKKNPLKVVKDVADAITENPLEIVWALESVSKGLKDIKTKKQAMADIDQSTTGMQTQYQEAVKGAKFDGSQVLPKELTDHVVDDIAGKLTMHKLSDKAKAISTLKGKEFTSLAQIKEEAIKIFNGAKPTSVAPEAVATGVVAETELAGGPGLIERLRTVLSERNVDPKVKASVERLIDRQGIGETKIKSPLRLYDELMGQEKSFKTDIKQDTALQHLGPRTGQAYDTVIEQRRAVGKVMGEELKKVGGTKTDIAPSFTSLEQELMEQGLRYNANTKKLMATDLSKVTGQDRALLQKYIVDLNKLGDKPTIAQLDAFMSRVPAELDVYKSANNITRVTNGERIIKNNLKQLRDQFSPEVTKNEALRPYFEARKTYADLSNFLDEGVGVLGKKTQSGDYAKDASLLKSSVQSILSQGKKDWLLRLEELTGYPALDEAVIALQAMKDSGNFRGLSLLEKLSEGGVPTSKGDIWGRMLDYVASKGTQAVAGTPEEQTRAFLKSLETTSVKPTKLPLKLLLDSEGENIANTKTKIPLGQKSMTTGPIDVVKTDDGYIVLDGQHRAVEALQKGVSDIDVNVLSTKEALSKYGDRWPQLETLIDESPQSFKSGAVPKTVQGSKEIMKQIADYKKEGIFLEDGEVFTISSKPVSDFDGVVIRSTQGTVDKSGVNKWKKAIEGGERPAILIKEVEPNKYRIVDGHHRATAYKQLGIKDIPVIIKPLIP